MTLTESSVRGDLWFLKVRVTKGYAMYDLSLPGLCLCHCLNVSVVIVC